MLKQLVFISILALLFPTSAQSKSIYLIKDEDITQAAEYFEKGQYAEAKAMYLDLAGAGDKYAQYVLSVIELQGLVEEPNLAKAYAWAKVAKESNNEKLKNHFEKISALVANPNEEKYLSVSSDIYQKYSNMGVARRYLNHLKRELPKCTGSRIRGNVSACQRIKVSCDPMVFSKSAMDSCLEFVAKIHPENLKILKKDINQLQTFVKKLEQQSGSVTISDANQ